MKLKSLKLEKFPGLTRPLVLENIGPGLNVIVGPNASGKTSICQAVRRLLWPHAMTAQPYLIIRSTWEVQRGECSLEITQASSKEHPVVIEPRGVFALESLPDAAFMPCFSLTIDELFDERDRCFAEKLGQEMMGGYDLEKAIAPQAMRVPVKAAASKWKAATRRLEQYRRAEQQLKAESIELPQLDLAIAEAEKAQHSAWMLDKKIEFAGWQAEKKALEEQLADFPPELALSTIYPTDEQHYLQAIERKQELAKIISQLEVEVGDLEHIHISNEELEAQRLRIGRMQMQEAACLEKQKQIEKLTTHVESYASLLGELPSVEHLDLLGTVWKEVDKIEMEMAGLQEQLRLYPDGEVTAETLHQADIELRGLCDFAPFILIHHPLFQGFLAFLLSGTALGLAHLWQVSGVGFWAAVAVGAILSAQPLKWGLRYLNLKQRYPENQFTEHLKNTIARMSQLQWQQHQQQRRQDLEIRFQQKQTEHRNHFDKLHEQALQAGIQCLSPTYIELIEEFKRWHGISQTLQEARIELKHLQAQLHQEKAAWDQFQGPGNADPWRVYTKVQHRLSQKALLENARGEYQQLSQQLEQMIQRIGSPDVLQLIKRWPAYQQIKEEQRRLNEVILKDLMLKRSNLLARLEQKEASLEGEALLQEANDQMKQVQSICLDFVKRELLAKLAADVKHDFHQECQPVVLETAMEWFQVFTRHQFRLEMPMIRAEEIEYVVIETSTGERRSLDQLSRGTRMQLLIAIRLAFALHSEKSGEPLPIFLDEVLANTDEERFDAIALVVSTLVASGRQVFYLTCNKEDARKWQKQCPDLHLIDLANLQANLAHAAAPFVPNPDSQRVKKPEGLTLHEYIQALKLPAIRLDEPLQMASIHYLVDDPEDLYRLLSAGIQTYGQFMAQRSQVRALFAHVEQKAPLLEQFFALRTQGRGKKLTQEALLQGGISKTFLKSLWEMAQDKECDPMTFVLALEDKKDKRRKGLRKEAQAALKNYLLEAGYLDERPILSPDQIRCELLPLLQGESDRTLVELLLCE